MVDKVTRLATPRRDIPNEMPEVERLSAMVTALLSELTITRERLDTVERLLEAANVLSREHIESFEPDEGQNSERDRIRRRQIAKVMRPLRIDLEKAVANLPRKVAEADEVLREEVRS